MRAHHTEGELVSDHETLVRLAAEVGLPGDEVREMLASDRFAAEVREDEADRPRHRHQRRADVRGRPPHRRLRRPAARGPARAAAQGRAGQPTAISSASANGGTSSMRSPLQKRPGSYQLAGRRLGSRPIALVGGGDELGAVDRLERALAAPVAAGQPLAREPGRARERAAVEALDHLDQLVLVLALSSPSSCRSHARWP